MVSVIIARIVYAFFFYQFLFNSLRIGGFLSSVAIVGVLFIILVLWSVHKLAQPGKKAKQAAARAAADRQATARAVSSLADSGTVSFRVAGVTFDNDDGSSRQDILRHMKFGDSPWADDPDDLVATLEETTFDGDLAFAVLINGYQIGFVPKASIQKVAEAQRHPDTCFVSSVRVTGGGTGSDGRDLSFGCEIVLEY